MDVVMHSHHVVWSGARRRRELLAKNAHERRVCLAAPGSNETGMGGGALWLTGLAAFVRLVLIAAPLATLWLS